MQQMGGSAEICSLEMAPPCWKGLAASCKHPLEATCSGQNAITVYLPADSIKWLAASAASAHCLIVTCVQEITSLPSAMATQHFETCGAACHTVWKQSTPKKTIKQSEKH